jgi:hypothetical protein
MFVFARSLTASLLCLTLLPWGILAPAAEKLEARDLLTTEKVSGEGVWIDPALAGHGGRVTVWFDEQFLGDGKAYPRRAREFARRKRRELRAAVVKTLKALSARSHAAAEKDLKKLQDGGEIRDLERHWIVNGFSCTATAEGVKALAKVKGVKKVFAAPEGFSAQPPDGKPEFFAPAKREKFDPKKYKHPWYTRSLLADRVWREFGVTGKGTLNVVHDFNFVFSDNLTPNLYRNPGEVPGNGKDDDGNGLVDDVHGYNFLHDSALLTLAPVPAGAAFPQRMHAFLCAAIICGAGVKGKEYEFGLAPEAHWAGVIAGPRIEAAVEWAIEQGADSYSMSFSLPGLGEYRSHWRKVMEHGSFCGVCFVSGAGNFAQSAKVPVQMRTPEDIPEAVFAAAGVRRDLGRTPFSSKGPVEWKTEHYQDGRVAKPEVCAFNQDLPLLKRDGTVVDVAINGNSFAGPMFAGSIALMLSADPDLLPWDLKAIITSTATDVAAKGVDPETGHGLINTYRAVKEVLRRKAKREGKDTRKFAGRVPGDALDPAAVRAKLKVRLTVARVQPGSQAARLGVRVGDVLVRYHGVEVTDTDGLRRALRKADADKPEGVEVVIERDGKPMKFTFEPGTMGVVPAPGYNQPVFE